MVKFFHTLPHHGNAIAQHFELVKSQVVQMVFPTKISYFIGIVCGYK